MLALPASCLRLADIRPTGIGMMQTCRFQGIPPDCHRLFPRGSEWLRVIQSRMQGFEPDIRADQPLGLSALPVSGPCPAPHPFPRPRGIYRNGGKRAFEVLLILLAAPVVVPLVLVIAALVACDGHNPFFAQKRIGRGGKVFRIWKLRSMVVDAESRLQAHLQSDPEALAQWQQHQKLKSDPRITPVGRVIRKISADELPQLLNVLNGSMSLIGPRPMMTGQRHMYPGLSYRQLRPGITGLWQISARNESEFVARVRYDDEYHRILSFGTDLRILARTVLVVLRGTGY